MVLGRAIVTSAIIAATAGLALAGSHGGNPAVKARKAQMQLQMHNLGILGGMAKGDSAYDAEVAKAAANNLVSLSNISHIGYWTPGTSTDDLPGETRALPALWGSDSQAREIVGKVGDAAAALAAVAGDGQEALGPALGDLGGACTECHKLYRQSNN